MLYGPIICLFIKGALWSRNRISSDAPTGQEPTKFELVINLERPRPEADKRRTTMRKMTRRVLGTAGLALIVTTSVVWAQEAQPVRVRGEIAKVEGNTLLI